MKIIHRVISLEPLVCILTNRRKSQGIVVSPDILMEFLCMVIITKVELMKLYLYILQMNRHNLSRETTCAKLGNTSRPCP
jgi:hypothetical protein